MVDVSAKEETLREARATAKVKFKKEVLDLIKEKGVAKGDIFALAKTAGILGAKNTGNLIPLCHNLGLDFIEIDFDFINEEIIQINAYVKSFGKTGVEMEALSAVSISALTIYDMCKALDKSIEIKEIYLLEKSGGKSGIYKRN
ncbi:MAG: cyclic pyranopterin monophosphate synthase MoaC [Armatimonadetes bacterium]|nr:cyclic pyranopterin monophosphate synthase MoaC [Armatimonadota bacterium]